MTTCHVNRNQFLSDPDDEFSFGRDSKNSSSRSHYAYGKDSLRDGGLGRDDGPFNGPTGGSRDDELFSRSSGSFGGELALSRYEQLQQQKQQSMNRQIEATNRCLASIYDSEQIGIATAEELLAQGEQLDNVERKLDKILIDTKTSQRHLNGIKSIFGGLKNWWTGDGKKEETAPPPTKKQSEELRNAMSVNHSPGSHPAFGLRSGDVRGFYGDDAVEFSPNDNHGFGGQKTSISARSGVEATGGGHSGAKSSGRSAEWNEYEDSLNKNLNMMSGGIAHLKTLATGLGSVIEAQNDQIENRIMPKAEKADLIICDQNRQMSKIVKK